MDVESRGESPVRLSGLDFAEAEEKPKSALRMIYAAEIKVFKAQHGGLEEIRQKLGFSRRKMCQLLMVDPSAWTRWCKDESKVPPHVYRSLEWFLALHQKALTSPDLGAFFLSRHKISANPPADWSGEIRALKNELQKQRLISWLLSGAVAALGVSLVWLLI